LAAENYLRQEGKVDAMRVFHTRGWEAIFETVLNDPRCSLQR
jgi:hypothetical protein